MLLDCGQMFAGDDLPGVDAVLPDFEWLLGQPDGVEACIATHAHEDHIGALPHLLRHIEFPIYGSEFTLGMIKHKLEEADLLDRTELRQVTDGDRVDVGPFNCEFMPVTHSIPSGLMTAFSTPQGVILHSSDFKLDLTPVDGRRTDLSRIGAIGHDPGVRLLEESYAQIGLLSVGPSVAAVGVAYYFVGIHRPRVAMWASLLEVAVNFAGIHDACVADRSPGHHNLAASYLIVDDFERS